MVRVGFNHEGKISGLFFFPPRGGRADQLNLALVASYIIAVFVDITAPFMLALLLWRRFQCRWRYFLVGLLVFLLFQGVTRIPFVLALQSYPPFQQLLQQPLYLWTWLLLLCFTAGLFEEGGRALAFRYAIAREDRKWSTAAMLGAGHGGLEAIGAGLIVLTFMINYVVLLVIPEALGIAQDTIESARGQMATVRGWEPLMDPWERICALIVQLALSVMVLQAFLNRRMWWWCALLVHTLINFTGVAILQLGTAAWGRPMHERSARPHIVDAHIPVPSSWRGPG